jgi:hypothetical protein
MREANVINEGIARDLVGRTHATGKFIRYEHRGGRIFLVSQCSQCGAPNSNISVMNAGQAAKNSTVRLIACQHCKYTEPTAAPTTYETVIRVPEGQRTAEQQRLVAQQEITTIVQAPVKQRRAEDNAREQAARVAADRAARRSMFESHERFLTALAHIENVPTITHPNVLNHDDYVSWEQWQALSDEVRAETSKWVDQYFANTNLSSLGI